MSLWSITWKALSGEEESASQCVLVITEIADEDNSTAAMYQAVGELPQANRDTLAFLMIHLQRSAQQGLSWELEGFPRR